MEVVMNFIHQDCTVDQY